MRQYSDRYTIRAGRNLPDKEFRYLRTVIVTAAVYLVLSNLHSHVFLINSRLNIFSAATINDGVLYPEVTGLFCLVP